MFWVESDLVLAQKRAVSKVSIGGSEQGCMAPRKLSS